MVPPLRLSGYSNCGFALVTSAESAEIIKHASNAFLALKISFINAVANLAEAVATQMKQVETLIGDKVSGGAHGHELSRPRL